MVEVVSGQRREERRRERRREKIEMLDLINKSTYTCVCLEGGGQRERETKEMVA